MVPVSKFISGFMASVSYVEVALMLGFLGWSVWVFSAIAVVGSSVWLALWMWEKDTRVSESVVVFDSNEAPRLAGIPSGSSVEIRRGRVIVSRARSV